MLYYAVESNKWEDSNMQWYQCPNCGRTYSENERKYYCTLCNYKLLKKEDIKEIKHPELSKRDYKVIGTVGDPTKPIITCPYCKSTNTTKIGVVKRSMSFGLFGFGSGKVGKQWHCNACKSDF